MKKIFFLDAYALIYRAYFALNKNPRINSKGLNTSAIMGFLNTLYEVLKNEKPTHIGVAFDLGAPTLRTDDFSAYKANREETPPDIKISVPYIKEIIKAFNIPIFEREGYEADDIIGTLSKKAEKEGFTTFMMTPDKDFGQLVSDNIFIYKPAKGGEPAKVLGPKEVCERYGITRPEQVIDILGLWGDASDNIPGIPGIGEKTAAKLIVEFDSVENIIANADKLKGKMRENVINFAQQGLLSKKLATIDTNVPVEFNEDELKVKDPNIQRLTELFEELEFRTFLARFKGQRSAVSDQQSAVSGQRSAVKVLVVLLTCSLGVFIISPPDSIYKMICSTEKEVSSIDLHESFDEVVKIDFKEDEIAFDSISAFDVKEKQLIAVVSSGCKYCKLGLKKISLMMKNGGISPDDVDIFIWGSPDGIIDFRSETMTEDVDYWHIMPNNAIKVTYGRFPIFIMMENKNIIKIGDFRDLDDAFVGTLKL